MKKATERRSLALTRMLDKGFLKQAQFETAKEEPVHLMPMVDAGSELAPEVVSIVRKTLHDLVPERAAQGGFTVHTTIDPKMQAAARKAVRENLQAYDKRHALQGALPVPAEPAPPKTSSRGKAPPPPPKQNPKNAPFEGTPSFESHRVYVGVVESANDDTGTFDVRVGTVLGVVRLAGRTLAAAAGTLGAGTLGAFACSSSGPTETSRKPPGGVGGTALTVGCGSTGALMSAPASGAAAFSAAAVAGSGMAGHMGGFM